MQVMKPILVSEPQQRGFRPWFQTITQALELPESSKRPEKRQKDRYALRKSKQHERSKWAQKGYPGLHQKNGTKLAELYPQTLRRVQGLLSTP